jgi:hypothetical protein
MLVGATKPKHLTLVGRRTRLLGDATTVDYAGNV